jgi:hypothetical protein
MGSFPSDATLTGGFRTVGGGALRVHFRSLAPSLLSTVIGLTPLAWPLKKRACNFSQISLLRVIQE